MTSETAGGQKCSPARRLLHPGSRWPRLPPQKKKPIAHSQSGYRTSGGLLFRASISRITGFLMGREHLARAVASINIKAGDCTPKRPSSAVGWFMYARTRARNRDRLGAQTHARVRRERGDIDADAAKTTPPRSKLIKGTFMMAIFIGHNNFPYTNQKDESTRREHQTHRGARTWTMRACGPLCVRLFRLPDRQFAQWRKAFGQPSFEGAHVFYIDF